MPRALALGLLALSTVALGVDVKSTTNEEADLEDDVQMIQLTNRMDSRKHKVAVDSTPKEVQIQEGEAVESDFQYAGAFTETSTTPVTAFANISAVQLNGAGDLPEFLAALEFNIELIVFFVICFMVLLRCFPNMYAFRATGAYLEGAQKKKAQTAPFTWDATEKSWFNWMWYAFAPYREQLIESCGLDAAMLLGFTDMSMEILFWVGLPFLCILCPIYAFCGGMAAGDDRLSHLGIGNVALGTEASTDWIFVLVACTTWYVVLFVQWRCFAWMKHFIFYREEYLLQMPMPQRNTVLVEGIPDELCSDAALKAYFSKMFGQYVVKDAYVVKKIAGLEKKVLQFKYTDRKLKETLFWIKNNPGKPKPKFHLMHGAQEYEDYYKSELERLTAEIKAEQAATNLEARKAPEETSIYATNGFVTFMDRKVAEKAQGCPMFRIADDELVVSYPPMPDDVIWSDLEESVAARQFFHFIGYGCIVGLFLGFMPIVIAISQAANLDNLEEKMPWFKNFTDALGDYRDTLAGTMASLGLTLMMSFLPTFLLLIFGLFFTLKAERWAQLYCQTYYFWFLVLFVLLTTAIGSNLADFLQQIAESPFSIFSVLADSMPLTTHFYLNYLSMQWVTHAMNLTRYIQFTKYCMFKRLMDPEDARALAEPEDQDYYGMGSRSARFAFTLVLGLVFSSICPLMVVLTWINFLLCKLFYGYLIPYAEEKKKDLGGDHFALQLLHVQLGLLIYIIMMTGIMFARANSKIPGFISASCFLWWFVMFNRFRTKLHWQNLCYQDVVEKADSVEMKVASGSYTQEALDPDVLVKIQKNPFDDDLK